jgi:hypothetical protein
MDMTQWNVSYQRQFASNWMASVTYLGNRTNHIWSGYELNPAIYIPGQSTTGNTNQRRLLNLMNPKPGSVLRLTRDDRLRQRRYNGICSACRSGLTRGWSMNVNYTESKCRNNCRAGNGHRQQLSRSSRPQHELGTLRGGPSTSVQRRIHRAEQRRRVLGRTSDHQLDWQLGTIVQARSGRHRSRPSTDRGPGARPGSTTSADHRRRPELSNRTSTGGSVQTPLRPILRRLGEYAKGAPARPAYWNVDMALSRNLAVGTRSASSCASSVQRVQSVAAGNPNVTFGNANFGRITTTDPPRIMQFAAKYSF